MLNITDYSRVYQRLREISEFDSDIYMSEDYEALLVQSGMGTREDNIGSLVQMQSASEGFRQNDILGMSDLESDATIFDKHSSYIIKTLKRKLKRYSAEEQRAIMIDMIENARELSGDPVDGQVNFQLLQKPNEELEKQLTDLISRLSFSVMESKDVECFENSGEMICSNGSHSFSSGAGAGAAYVCDEQLRNYPEIIGMVSGAASLTASSMSRLKDETAADVVSLMLLLVSTSMIISILFAVSVGTGSIAAAIMAEENAVLSFASLADIFMYCFRLFTTELQIAVGMGVSGVVVEAVSLLKDAGEKENKSYSLITEGSNDWENFNRDDIDEDDRNDEDDDL